MRVFPVTIDDPERDVFVWGPSSEPQETSILVPWFFDDPIRRCLRLVNEVRIEDIELQMALLAYDVIEE